MSIYDDYKRLLPINRFELCHKILFIFSLVIITLNLLFFDNNIYAYIATIILALMLGFLNVFLNLFKKNLSKFENKELDLKEKIVLNINKVEQMRINNLKNSLKVRNIKTKRDIELVISYYEKRLKTPKDDWQRDLIQLIITALAAIIIDGEINVDLLSDFLLLIFIYYGFKFFRYLIVEMFRNDARDFFFRDLYYIYYNHAK